MHRAACELEQFDQCRYGSRVFEGQISDLRQFVANHGRNNHANPMSSPSRWKWAVPVSAAESHAAWLSCRGKFRGGETAIPAAIMSPTSGICRVVTDFARNEPEFPVALLLHGQ